MSIWAHEQQLAKIFSQNYLFQIPEYQRPYAWTTEQVGELLDDLVTAMDRDQNSPYFLGSIVLIKELKEPSAEVVDGQQRLTTLTIMLCVLRELIQDIEYQADLDNYIRERGKPVENIPGHYRLNLRAQDCTLFRDKVQHPGGLKSLIDSQGKLSDSQDHIRENAQFLWKVLKDYDLNRRQCLAMFLATQCYLVVVGASDQDSAYRIFSVMNDRGLDLSATDILKAEIIGSIEPDQRSRYATRWEAIEEDLGRDDFRDLFAHIRMIYCKSKAQGSLTREFREGVLQNQSGGGTQFIDGTLEPMSNAYRIVSRAAYENTENPEAVNGPLKHLGRLDNFDWIPPAMAFFSRYPGERKRLAKFVQALERLAFGMFILRWNVNWRIDRYSKVLQEIECDRDLQASESSVQLSEEEKCSVREALNGPLYLQTRVRLPVLLRLDSLLADVGAEYDRRVLSVEHVLPQNPQGDSDWMRWFPDDAQREDWTHKLANLVLLSRRKNARASNYDFEKKKSEYFMQSNTTPFAITGQVREYNEWTPKVLERRQQELVNYLVKEWCL